MKVYKYILLTVFCFISSVATLSAQQRISGQVSDAMGPLMMVNVVEMDKDNRYVNHATTDFDGNFTMIVKSNKNKLKISYVGCKDEILEIGDRTVFNVMMKDENLIQEVVIQAKPRTSSGGLNILEREVSVAKQTFKMSEMEGLSFASVDEALQGQIAGLDIVFNSGDVGSGTQMRLRGTSTINGNQQPLIVVNDNIFEMPDGQEFDPSTANEETFAQLLTVNPDDIESIEVLKDASASAIWGSRGSNGVIMIKTKRGSRGKTKVTYSYRYTNAWLPKGLNLLNGDDYTMLLKEEHFNPTQSSTASDADELAYKPEFPEYENYNNNTDWVKLISKHGHTHDHNISLTGGGEKATFRISGGYYTQSGQIIKQKLDRFSTRMALDYFVSDRIKVSSDFSLTYTNNDKNYQDLLPVAQVIMPNMSVFSEYRDTNGNLVVTDDYYLMRSDAWDKFDGNQKGLVNPVAMGNLAWRNEKSYRIIPQISLDYKLLGVDYDEHQLNYYGMVNMDASTLSNSAYRPGSLSNSGFSATNYNESWVKDQKTLSFNTRHRLNFTPKFDNENHMLTMMGQFELGVGNGNDQESTSYGIPTGITSTTTGTHLNGIGTNTWQWRSIGMVFSAVYSYMEGRYSATATLRRDGSTKFGPKNRWGNFPGVSLRWNIIDEPWMEWSKEKIKLSMLSFRPGWGMTGQQPGQEYLFYSIYKGTGGYYLNTPTFRQENLMLANLKWAIKNEYNIGADFGFFNDKLTGSFNYYDNTTSDQLMWNYGIPSSNGYSVLAYKNTGAIRNYGWELNINGNKFIEIGKFSITAYANVAQNFNTILEMEESVLKEANEDFNYSNGSYLKRIQLGNPLGSIYGFRYKGVYVNNYNTNWSPAQWEQARIEAEAMGKQLHDLYPVACDDQGNTLYGSDGKPLRMVYNYKDGQIGYPFRGGDAIYEDINKDGNINELDIVYLGNSNPKLQGGFGLKFQYKRITLNTQFTYRYGVDVINTARMNVENMYTNNNQSIAVNWRWRKEGDGLNQPCLPRALYNTGYNWLGSDRYVEDASYLRLSYLQLSYSVDPNLLKKYGLNQLSLSGSANNLFFLTKYTGLDPEINADGWGRAFDGAKTPRSRSFTLSLTLGF